MRQCCSKANGWVKPKSDNKLHAKESSTRKKCGAKYYVCFSTLDAEANVAATRAAYADPTLRALEMGGWNGESLDETTTILIYAAMGVRAPLFDF